MKILILNSFLRHGGVERQIGYLVAGLRERGHAVKLAVLEPPDGSPEPDVLSLRWPGFFVPGARKLVVLPRFLRKFARLVGQERPDVLHTWGPYENLAAARVASRLRVPVITSVRTNLRWAFKFARSWARRSSMIVANAREVTETLKANYHVPADRVALIRNALPLDRYPYYSERGFAKESITLGVVGRLSPSKNQLLLLRILPELQRAHPNARIHVSLVGSEEKSDYRGRIDSAIREYNLEHAVTIEPYTDNIQQVYRSLDLLVLPSRSEGLPNVLLEAMAMGTPWLASDIADNAWLAGEDEVRGLLFKDDSPESLREAVDRWISEPSDVTRERAERARRFVEESFSVEKAVDSFEQLYEGVMSTARGGNR